MQFLILTAAFLGLAVPTISIPLGGSSAIEARDTVDALLTCTANILNIQTLANAAKLYTLLCINDLHCQHSIAPSLGNGEFIGVCTGCPLDISPNKVGDCIYVPQ